MEISAFVGRSLTGDKNAENDVNKYLEFEVEVDKGGTYALQIFHSNDEIFGTHGYNTKIIDKFANIKVNDQDPKRYFFINSISRDTFKEKTVYIELEDGKNTIKVFNDDSWLVRKGIHDGSEQKAGLPDWREADPRENPSGGYSSFYFDKPGNIPLVNSLPNLSKFIVTPAAVDAPEAPAEHLINVRSSVGGTVTADKNVVADGGAVTLTIAPKTSLIDVRVNGVSRLSDVTGEDIRTLVVDNVMADVTVQVVFAAPKDSTGENDLDSPFENNSFGTGDTTGWIVTGDANVSVGSDPFHRYGTKNYLKFSGEDAYMASISQTVKTPTEKAEFGDACDVSFVMKTSGAADGCAVVLTATPAGATEPILTKELELSGDYIVVNEQFSGAEPGSEVEIRVTVTGAAGFETYLDDFYLVEGKILVQFKGKAFGTQRADYPGSGNMWEIDNPYTNVFDGKTDTYFDGQPGAYVGMHFDEGFVLHEVRIVKSGRGDWAANRVHGSLIQGSNDAASGNEANATWTQIGSVPDLSLGNPQTNIVKVANSTKYTSYRLYKSSEMELNELEFWGTYDAGPPEPKPEPNGTALYGTPTLGGDALDPIWKTASELLVQKHLTLEDGPASGVGKLLWDDENLYVLMQVTDPVLNSSGSSAHLRDSVEIFVDESNSKASSYGAGMGQYRVSYENEQSFNPSSISAGFESFAKIVDGGYILEVKIPFKMLTPKNDHLIGFDLQINDANADGDRQDVVMWNDETGNSWQNGLKWGIIKLVKDGGKPVDSNILYFVDAGDHNPATLSEDDAFGIYNTVTDQIFGADPGTGKRWGVYDYLDPTGANGPTVSGSNGAYTQYTRALNNTDDEKADGQAKTSTCRYAHGQDGSANVQNQVGELYVDYKFELEAGKKYDVEVCVGNYWGNSSPVSVYANRGIGANIETQPGTLLRETVTMPTSENVVVTGEVYADDDGILTINVRRAYESGTINVNYIIIRGSGTPDGANKTTLNEAITEAEGLKSHRYTEDSFAAMQKALAAAKLVSADDDATQEAVDAAAAALRKAIDGLIRVGGANADILRAVIASYDGKFTEELYPVGLWAEFAAALAYAESVCDPATLTHGQMTAAIDRLQKAAAALAGMELNKTELGTYIEIAKGILERSERYNESSIERLKDALSHAEDKYDNARDQNDINSAASRLLSAITALVEDYDLSILQDYVDLISGYNESQYTEDSWADLMAALGVGKTVLAEEEPVKDRILFAINAIKDALRDLKVKVNYEALDAVIENAEAIMNNIEKYVGSTVTGLADALDEAIRVRNDSDASQSDVNKAAKALAQIIAKARFKLDLSDLEDLLKAMKAIDLSKYTLASANQVHTAIQVAEAITENDTQEDLDLAIANLKAARDGLELPGSTGNNSKPNSPGGTNKPDSEPNRGGNSGGSRTISDTPTPLAPVNTVRWIEKANGKHSKDTGIVGIRKTALAIVTGSYTHDTIANGAVQVRVTLAAAQQAQKDMLLTGYVQGATVNTAKATFTKWYRNRTAVVALEQTGSFGMQVKVAAKADLTGMNTDNLCFYSYNKATNTFKKIDTDYRIDKKVCCRSWRNIRNEATV